MTTLNNSNNKRSMFGIEDVNADSIDTTNLICDTLVITTSGTAPTLPSGTNTNNIATTAFVLANQPAETFQDVYDNSITQPQIAISQANKALQIKGNSLITNCLEILDESGVSRATLSRDGLLTVDVPPICRDLPTINFELANKEYVDSVAAGNLDTIISSSNSTAVTMYNNLTTGSVTMGANLTSGFLRIGSNASDLIIDSGVVDMINAELKCQTYNASILNADVDIATNLVFLTTRPRLTIGSLPAFAVLQGYTTDVIADSVLTLKSNTNNVLIEGAGVNITSSSISLNAPTSNFTITDININSTSFDIDSNYIKSSASTNVCFPRAVAGAYYGNASGASHFWAPIFNSISNFSDFYTNNVSSGIVDVGTSVSCNYTINDDLYIVMPGYRLVIYPSQNYGGTRTLDYTNGSSAPQSIRPTPINAGRSCLLYFNGVQI